MNLIIFFIFLVICQLIFFIVRKPKYDGRIVIDEAADSWEIHITEDPELIKNMDFLTLKVEKLKK